MRSLHHRLRVIAVAFLIVACGCASAVSQPPLAGPSEVAAAAAVPASLEVEYAVYSAALNHIHGRTPTDTFYVTDSTVAVLTLGPREGVPRWLREMSDVPQEMIESYVERNSEPLALAAERFVTDRPVQLTSTTRGLITITLSRAGFNADRTEAVVHTIRRCGPRCGGGFIMRFSFVDGQWIVRPGRRTFIM